MKKSSIGLAAGAVLVLILCLYQFRANTVEAATDKTESPAQSTDSYTGSASCRKCHERFYRLWAPSHHGLAMQPFTAELARTKLSPQTDEIVIGNFRYRADIAGKSGWVIEQGPQGEKKYRIEHVMGGKNVYYFLTALDRGRLQTLPVAYDVNEKKWFDMAASGIRHFPGRTDEPINWKDWQYTFNTACYGCHVSQVSTNYDLKTDSYHTVWKEPGINCEACHGPAGEHIRVCEAAPRGTVPKDLKITRGGRDFSKEQNNATCSSCHAKAVVLTETFRPGDRFYDHFGLVTLENPDYYPDGRDLGENYTYTSWSMSPCAKSGKLDCLHCHTSSGRYKFKAKENAKANQACMPCHKEKVDNPTEHTHHKADSPGNSCIACHMPMTEFARMHRSDHSMLPPTPAATIAFKSPNACNGCHKDKTPQWADETVRKWRKRDYQAGVLHRAALVNAARTRDWSKLPEMLDYVTSKDRDEVFAASLIRLSRVSGDPRIVPVLFKAVKDPSPLVRATAAEALQSVPTNESVRALVEAAGDKYRLVRVRAAASLAGFRNAPLTDAEKKTVEAANKEYLDSILSRPDQWESHYNLGNYYLDREDFNKAVASYETAVKMEPRGVLAMVNEAMAYARIGDNGKAADALQKALKVAPDNAAANFNMGLLRAEENDLGAAEKHLRAAFKADPQMARAAYNLSLILSKDRLDEAMNFCGKAAELRPDQPRYAYTLAFFRQQRGDFLGASGLLEGIVTKYPAYADAYVLLGGIYEKQGKKDDAVGVYNRGLSAAGILDQYKVLMKVRLDALKGAPPGEQKK
jgi:tetratricopeptide (TPR) repeat protein